MLPTCYLIDVAIPKDFIIWNVLYDERGGWPCSLNIPNVKKIHKFEMETTSIVKFHMRPYAYIYIHKCTNKYIRTLNYNR